MVNLKSQFFNGNWHSILGEKILEHQNVAIKFQLPLYNLDGGVGATIFLKFEK
jgi:acetyl-CoA carboxylase carboxyltransferase component